jgi:hypothetical protein
MHRSAELVLVVIGLVVIPFGVALSHHSKPASSARTSSALAFVQPLLVGTGDTAASCEWTQDHVLIACDLKGGGSCSFDTNAHIGTCSTTTPGRKDDFLVFGWASTP